MKAELILKRHSLWDSGQEKFWNTIKLLEKYQESLEIHVKYRHDKSSDRYWGVCISCFLSVSVKY